MDTVGNIRQVVRDRLEESTARFWSDAELTRALYEGAKWVARRGEVLEDTAPINVVPNQAKYPLPFDGLRVHRVDFTPLGQQVNTYPLRPSTLYEADAIWGSYQQLQGSFPQLFVCWGFPPGIAANTVAPNASTNAYWALQLYPVPSQPGTATVWYYRQPKALTGSDNDVLEIPGGYEDILVNYCEYVALRKDKDPQWQAAKQEFEQKFDEMIDRTRQLHDQSQFFHREGSYYQNNWVYSGSDDWC